MTLRVGISVNENVRLCDGKILMDPEDPRVSQFRCNRDECVSCVSLGDEDEAYLNRRSSLRGVTTLSSRLLASSPRNRGVELENRARARFSTSRPAGSTSCPLKFKPRTPLRPQHRRATPTR